MNEIELRHELRKTSFAMKGMAINMGVMAKVRSGWNTPKSLKQREIWLCPGHVNKSRGANGRKSKGILE